MTIIDVATASEKGVVNQSTSRDQRHDEEASPGKRRHRVKTHLTNGKWSGMSFKINDEERRFLSQLVED
jgi:hypothetical protein